MKDRLVLFIIVLLLGLTSCGMQKKALSQDIQADVRTESACSTSLISGLEQIVRAEVEDILAMEMSQNMTIRRRIWSPPDTTGKQYIVLEETVESVTAAQETRNRTGTRSEEVLEQTDSTSVSASVEDLVMDINTEQKEKEGLPWWQMTLMAIGAAVLLFLTIRMTLKIL